MKAVKEYWNRRPCNIKHSNREIGSKKYFEEVSRRKYFVEHHIPQFADFEKYKGNNILEVGCGIGTAAHSFIENGAIYKGIDISNKSIEIAKQRLKIFDLNGSLEVANIEEYVDNNRYDLIYSFGVLHHTENINKAIEKIYTLLNNGGEFKLMLYAKNSLKYCKIKDGLDQYEAQSGVPIANVYTHNEIKLLLKDFKNINIQQRHIFPYKIPQYKNYIYEKEDYFKTMPKELFECLENNFGWHLCITCIK